MNGNKAKLKFNPNNFEIIEQGEYVVCAVSGKNIPLNQLTPQPMAAQAQLYNINILVLNYFIKGIKI